MNNNITDFSEMFYQCSTLLYFPDIVKLEIFNISNTNNINSESSLSSSSILNEANTNKSDDNKKTYNYFDNNYISNEKSFIYQKNIHQQNLSSKLNYIFAKFLFKTLNKSIDCSFNEYNFF